MRTHTHPTTGTRYHELTYAELRKGDEITPWNVADLATVGTFRVTAEPKREGDQVELTVTRAGTDRRPADDLVRILERPAT